MALILVDKLKLTEKGALEVLVISYLSTFLPLYIYNVEINYYLKCTRLNLHSGLTHTALLKNLLLHLNK